MCCAKESLCNNIIYSNIKKSCNLCFTFHIVPYWKQLIFPVIGFHEKTFSQHPSPSNIYIALPSLMSVYLYKGAHIHWMPLENTRSWLPALELERYFILLQIASSLILYMVCEILLTVFCTITTQKKMSSRYDAPILINIKKYNTETILFTKMLISWLNFFRHYSHPQKMFMFTLLTWPFQYLWPDKRLWRLRKDIIYSFLNSWVCIIIGVIVHKVEFSNLLFYFALVI